MPFALTAISIGAAMCHSILISSALFLLTKQSIAVPEPFNWGESISDSVAKRSRLLRDCYDDSHLKTMFPEYEYDPGILYGMYLTPH